jgi:hypothetical protein
VAIACPAHMQQSTLEETRLINPPPFISTSKRAPSMDKFVTVAGLPAGNFQIYPSLTSAPR